MKLFIIRHGDPDYAHDSLTERGFQEAELLSVRLLKENITDVYCSPLGRAQATAKPFLEKTGLHSETLDWLQEFPRPIIQPLKELGLADEDRRTCPWDLHPEVFNRYYDQITDPLHWSELPMYQVEGAAEMAGKIKDQFFGFLSKLGLVRSGCGFALAEGTKWDQLKEKNIAFFCHMGLGSLLTAYLGLVPPPVYWQEFRVMPTSVTTVLFQKIREDFVQSKIFTVGDVTHLASLELTYRG